MGLQFSMISNTVFYVVDHSLQTGTIWPTRISWEELQKGDHTPAMNVDDYTLSYFENGWSCDVNAHQHFDCVFYTGVNELKQGFGFQHCLT